MTTRKVLDLGRIVGPYEEVPKFDNFRLSPLGVITKKQPGEFRMIQHLSFPEGSSVNESIPKEFTTIIC